MSHDKIHSTPSLCFHSDYHDVFQELDQLLLHMLLLFEVLDEDFLVYLPFTEIDT